MQKEVIHHSYKFINRLASGAGRCRRLGCAWFENRGLTAQQFLGLCFLKSAPAPTLLPATSTHTTPTLLHTVYIRKHNNMKLAVAVALLGMVCVAAAVDVETQKKVCGS